MHASPPKGTEAPEAEPAEDRSEAGPLDCLSGRLRRGISRGMFRYGGFATRRPLASLLLSLCYVLACAPGFALLKFSADETNMYIRGSLTMAAYDEHKKLFPFKPHKTGSFQLFVAKPGKAMMSQESLLEVGRAVDRVLAVTTPSGDRFAEACERSWRGICEVDSVFHYFRDLAPGLGLNVSTPAGMGEVEGLASHLAAFCAAQPALCYSALQPQYGLLMGSDGTSPPGLGGLSVDSFQVVLYLDPKRKGRGAVEFQAAILQYTHAPSYAGDKDNLQTDNFYVTSYSMAVLEAESARPSMKEAHLMGIAFNLTLLFVCCSIFAPPSLEHRVFMGLCSMAVMALSLGCSIGLTAYVGVPFTTQSTLVIFTLFGVSVDDVIVIVHAYDRLPGERTLENLDRDIQKALQTSAPAITLTTATSLVAFLCAAFCPIPNITFFCVTAAFGILSVFVLQLTLFVPLFFLDERGRLAGRRSFGQWMCQRRERQEGSPGKEALPSLGEPSKVWRAVALPSVQGGFGIVDAMAKALSSSHAAQAAIVLLFAGALGFGVWGTTQASSDADLTGYFIDDSFVKNYFKIRDEQYTARAPFYLVVNHEGQGLDDARLSQVNSLFGDLAALDCFFEPHQHWLGDFEAYLNASHPSDLAAERARLSGDPGAFGAKVQEFLDAATFAKPDGSQVIPWRYKRNVVLEGGIVKHSRLVLMYEGSFVSQARYIDNMHRSLALLHPSGSEGALEIPRVPGTFGTTGMHPTAQRDEKVLRIIYENLAIACTAVAATVMLLLNPLVGLYVGLLVMGLDVIIVALLYVYGMKLDFVAFLCLSMTIGLVVDYSTHTAHAYMHHVGTPDEKLYHAISKMGASVLAGGGSTVLGILALAASGSEAFRSFFRVLGTAIFVGTVVGVTVGPVLLRVLHGAGLAIFGSLRLQQGQEAWPPASKTPEAESTGPASP